MIDRRNTYWRPFGLVLLLVLAFWAALPSPVQIRAAEQSLVGHKENEDLALYAAIIERVDKGEGYYQAAATEQRANNYPLKPFVTMRLPTLAVMTATLGYPLTYSLLGGIALALILAWWRRFEGAFPDPRRRISATMLVAAGAVLAARPGMILVHDLWAGLLIALSIGLYKHDRYWPAVLAGLAAVLIRELALPYLLLMLALSLWRRDWRESAAWLLAIACAGIALAFHASAVAAVVLPSDPASPGWASIGGWPMAVRALRLTTAARAFPEWLGIAVVILSLAGWLSWRSLPGRIVCLLLAGYLLLFALIGRPENFYWGMIVAPLLLVGLIFAVDYVTRLLKPAQSATN